MLLAVGEFAADTHDEDGAILLADSVFALFRRKVGVHLQQLFGVYEIDVAREEGLDLWVGLAGQVLCSQYGRVDSAHDALEELDVTLLGHHDGFPVPLVNVEGVEVVKLFVGTNGVHVGIDAIAGLDIIVGKGESLPFGEGVNHLRFLVAQAFDGECYGALYTVEVVVDAKTLEYEQGCGDATQTQLCGEVGLKEVLDELYTLLGLLQVEKGLVVFWFDELTHNLRLNWKRKSAL